MRTTWYISLFLILLIILPLSASQKIEWKVGNYWEYNLHYYMPQTNTQKILMRVINEENISVNGIIYESLVVEIKVNNLTKKILYYEKENLTIIKEIEYDGKKEEILSLPIISFLPIYEGKKWNFTRDNISISFQCVGKEKAVTKAGKFDCYKIRIIYDWTNNNYTAAKFYQLVYFSEEVGNIVKAEGFFNEAPLFSEELISYNYRNNSTIDMVFLNPLSFLIGVAEILYLLKKA